MAEKINFEVLVKKDKIDSLKGLYRSVFSARNGLFLYLLFFAFSIFTAFVISIGGLKAAVVLLVAVLGIPVAFISLFYLEYGIYIVLVISFFILNILRFIDLPLGLVMDVLISLMFFGLFVKQIKERDWSFAKNPITTAIIAWILYNVVSVVNPVASSRLAWAYTIRGMAGLMVLYFIALYAFKSINSITNFIKIWIALAFICALYGLYQEFHGLDGYDLRWIMQDPERYKLYFNWGKFRKFSFVANPTIFGILMGYSGLLCLMLLTGPFNSLKKALLAFCGIIMLWAMVYSGTRTAYAMVPAGFFFFALLTAQRNILIGIGAMFLMGAVIVFGPFKSLGPISTNTLERIRSTFKPEDDPSFNVRAQSQKFIQPYIQSHPMGGGLGSVGVWGGRFSPGSALSTFRPDSGYVRVAVELGWIGLFLYLYLMFIILKVGIQSYYRMREPKTKAYMGALLTVVYSLVVANYPQQAITMFPTMVIFYVAIAVIVKLNDLEKSQNLPNLE